jgi:hypothetical protein
VRAGRSPRRRRCAVVVAVLPTVLSLLGCSRAVDGVAMPGPGADLPASAADLERLIVPEVPSGLPRLPDDELEPPAGEKRMQDIADYATDPARELDVLEDYGYRYGWERFWGKGTGPVTSVFVDQFQGRTGAGSYAEDLARNDAEHYDGLLREDPPDLPGGCRSLTVDDADPEVGLDGPAAFAWCRHGVFSVAVSAVSDSVDAAEEEVRRVLDDQLDRLPPG